MPETVKSNKNELTKDVLAQMNLVLPKDFGDVMINTITEYKNTNQLDFPSGFPIGSAIKNAWIELSDTKYSGCSQQSVAHSLIKMCTLGLNPARNQCYFIKMGNKCVMLPSYFGKITALKRIDGVIDVVSDVIYEGTEYELSVNEFGMEEIKIIKPCPLKDRNKDKIVGAWACIYLDDKKFMYKKYFSIMRIDEIRDVWSMGSSGGKSKAHINFTNEMAKKSVINRCIKMFVNTLTDDRYFVDALVETTKDEYEYEGRNSEIFENKEYDDRTMESKDIEEKLSVGIDNLVDELEKEESKKENKKESLEKEEVKKEEDNEFDLIDDLSNIQF